MLTLTLVCSGFHKALSYLLDATIGFGQGKIMTVLALDARHTRATPVHLRYSM